MENLLDDINVILKKIENKDIETKNKIEKIIDEIVEISPYRYNNIKEKCFEIKSILSGGKDGM